MAEEIMKDELAVEEAPAKKTRKTTAKKAEGETTAKKATSTTKKVAAAKTEEVVAVKEVKAEAKTAPKAKKAEKKLKITLVKSGSGRLEKQTRTLEALGLRKTNSTTVKPDNACTRGMIFVVKHLVKVEEI